VQYPISSVAAAAAVAVETPVAVAPAVQLPAVAAVAARANGPDFEAASSFGGARLGYVFKLGAKGLGYYRDG